MKNWFLALLGLLMVLIGAVWALQGVGVIGGSFMSGATQWLAIGVAVLIAGLYVGYLGLRGLRTARRS